MSLFKGTSQRYRHLSTCLLFFRSYNEVFVQTAFIPYYLSTTSYVYYAPVVLLLLLPIFISLSLCVCLCSGIPHTIPPFLYLPFYFFAATTKCLYKRHLLPTSLLASIIFRCDHGPDSLHAVICDKLTFFTGGCSEGLSAFRFLKK